MKVWLLQGAWLQVYDDFILSCSNTSTAQHDTYRMDWKEVPVDVAKELGLMLLGEGLLVSEHGLAVYPGHHQPLHHDGATNKSIT